MRRPTILLAAMLLLPGAIRAQEEPEARRRVVYVPHEDLDAVVEKHGQGVLLSVPEYLALYEKAMAAGLEPAVRPAADAVILSGALTGTLADEGFALTACPARCAAPRFTRPRSTGSPRSFPPTKRAASCSCRRRASTN